MHTDQSTLLDTLPMRAKSLRTFRKPYPFALFCATLAGFIVNLRKQLG